MSNTITWSGHIGMTDASDMGWAPGRVPESVTVRFPDEPDGRPMVCRLHARRYNSDDEVVGWEYRSTQLVDGAWVVLVVYND